MVLRDGDRLPAIPGRGGGRGRGLGAEDGAAGFRLGDCGRRAQTVGQAQGPRVFPASQGSCGVLDELARSHLRRSRVAGSVHQDHDRGRQPVGRAAGNQPSPGDHGRRRGRRWGAQAEPPRRGDRDPDAHELVGARQSFVREQGRSAGGGIRPAGDVVHRPSPANAQGGEDVVASTQDVSG